MNMIDLITAKEVAERYGVDLRSVRYATKAGMLGRIQKFGWLHVYEVANLPEKWPVRGRAKNGSKTII